MTKSAAQRAQLRRGTSTVALAAALAASMGAAAHAGELAGRVTAAGANVPLEGAIVTVTETGATAATDQMGRFRFPDLAGGDYRIAVSYLGAPAASEGVAVPATGQVTLNFELGAGDSVMDNVLVIGQRGSLYASLNQQRAADNLVNVLSADAIGRLPDQNVAESVRRMPGISIENDQGEGRYVVIRGIDPNLNSTSINGVRIPSPESGDRKVALDVIDADILDKVVITKSLTPDLDGDGIGGNIDIETASGFDYDGMFVKGQIRGNYNELTDTLGEKLALSASNVFAGGRAAVAGSVSWNAREFATDNYEVDGGWSDEDAGDGDVLFPDEYELREYNVERERLSASLNFDFRPSDNTDLYVRGLFNDFRDQEYRQRVEIPFEDGNFVEAESSAANGVSYFTTDLGLDDDDQGSVDVQRDLKDREETQQIWSISAGGQTRANLWTIDYSAAYSHAEEEEPLAIDGVTFEADGDDGPDGYLIGLDASNPLAPQILYNDSGAAYFNDASNYEFDEMELVDGFTEDNEWALALDVQREVMWGDNPGYIKFGGKSRMREKSYDGAVTVYDGFDGPEFFLSDFNAPVDYAPDDFGPAVAKDFRDFFNANQSSFEIEPYDTLIANNEEDYDANEDIYALYAMARGDFGPLRLVGGLRWEHTEFDATASDLREYEETDDGLTFDETGGLPAGATCYNEDAETVSLSGSSVIDAEYLCIGTASGAREYDDYLPSANARWEVGEDMIVRASYYRSVARPNISQVVPVFNSEQDDDGEREAFIGNPDLERQVAENFDAGIEWYFSEGGVLSGGVFHKSISDYIATQILEDYTFKGIDFEEAEIAINLDDATITGFELNYSQVFGFLPSPFDGFIAGANYTWIDSEGTLADGREVALPKMSENIFGAQLGYDKYGFDIRLTVQYRDDYLDELGEDADEDRYIEDHIQWDARAQYDITDNFTVFADITNINDEPFTAYFLNDGQKLLSQYEEYSWSGTFGVKFQY